MLKTYRSLEFVYLSTTVIVDGHEVVVTFEGGSTNPIIRHGTYMTSDEKLQAALESKSGFGKSYELVSETKDEETGNSTSSGGTATQITGISNFQTAKGYILEHYPDVTLDQIKTKELLLAKAEELGIEFPEMS